MLKKIVWFVLTCFAIVGIYDLSRAPMGQSLPEPPGPKTPTSLLMTLKSVEISIDARKPYKTIFGCPPSDSECDNNNNPPVTMDVVGQTGLPGIGFGKGSPSFDEYKAVRLTLSATGRYTGTDPCTGIDVTNPVGDVIELPEKENENDPSVTINYMVPHPVLGLQTGFRLMQSLKVGLTPIDLRLVFTASHSVVCASSEKPLRAISGDLTLMAKPLGVALDPDPIIDEIALVNSDPVHNRITFYKRADIGDPQPLRSIEGAATGLDTPIGIYLDTFNDEIGVTNNGNNSVTIYNRMDSGNSTPNHLPLMGNQTGLNSPGMLAFYSDPSDHANDEILVANGGNNSITVYNRDQVVNSLDGNVAPVQTIGRDFVVTDMNPGANNNVINLTETGGTGNCTPNCNATITPPPNATGADLAAAVATALQQAPVTPGTSFAVTYDDITGLFTITVTTQNSGVSYTLNWNASTAAGVLGFQPVPSAALFSGSSVTSDFGDLTGLDAPCGIYVDPVNNEIGVANNGNSSITIYDRNDKGNVPPKRTISGPRTDLNGPCGIALYLDPGGDSSKDEIITANIDNSVRIYSRIANGNVPPLRTIKGNPTGLSKPVGIALHLDQSMDPTKDEIVVANSGHDSITIHKRYDGTVQLKSLPVMIPSGQQQTLFSQYSFSSSGTIDTPPAGKTPATPVSLNGYRFVWKITDERIRQTQDASSAYLFPPGNTVFQLTDGEIVPYLPVDCTQITPFITLTLSTNCPPSPLIHSPLPFAEGEYRVASVLFSAITFTKFPLASNPLEASEFPRLRPTVKFLNNNEVIKYIDEIDWIYTDEAGVELQSPLIFSQQFQINLTQPIGKVSPNCYKPVQGNNPDLVFDSGPLPPKDTAGNPVRSVSYIKNNKCYINFNDVDNIIFTVTDALSNSFVFTWKII